MKFVLFLAAACLASGQSNPASQAARAWRQAHEQAILSEFADLLSIPNVAADRENIRKNANLIRQMLEKRGVRTRLLEVPDANPAVYGELLTPGASRTVMFYAHYDGQPLDPKEWAAPPWQPVLRDRALDRDGQIVQLSEATRPGPEWRIYARSASDDKAPILAMVTALDAIKAAQLSLKSFLNIKVHLRRRRRGRFSQSGTNYRREQATLKKRCLVDLRWTGSPKPGADHRLRRARYRNRRYHAVWPEAGIA